MSFELLDAQNIDQQHLLIYTVLASLTLTGCQTETTPFL